MGACHRDAGTTLEQRSAGLATAAPATAAQVLATAQAQAGSPVLPAAALGFASSAGGLKPQFAASVLAGETKLANVVLPQLCSGQMHLADAATGAAVDISLAGALPVPGQSLGGYVVYPAALASGAALLHRPLPAGSEDFVSLPVRPATPEVDYTLTLGANVAGLRLVGGMLEMLDTGGAPRLHVPPPYIVGADGVRTDGTLAIAGCAFDTDPSAPWGRPITPPGAATCTVSVTWPDAAVVYPAILDPRWTTTGSMGTARFEHTITLLSTGKVLAEGGRSTTTGTTALNTAELYDPTSGTWSGTNPMASQRRLHTATQLPTSSNPTTSGKVLVAGGINGTTTSNLAELYTASTGQWSSAGTTMDAARHLHTATLLTDGRVLLAGGMNGTTTIATASLYNPASGSGTWAPTVGPIPPTGLKNHTATLIQTTNSQLNNHVLLVGGNNGSSTISSVYLFDPVQNAFSTLASIDSVSSPREQHTAVALPSSNGKILFAGGKNGSSVLATAIVFDPSSSNGNWATAGTMNSARVGHTMTVLPNSIVANGQVIVAGGSSTGSDTLTSTELFSGTVTWTTTAALPGPLKNQQAVLLSGNSVLVAGGLSSSTTVQTVSYLYDASFGLGCSSNSQCASGFCVSGICCDSACTGTCGACNLAGHLGACTALSSGTVCRAQNGACDVAETCDGTSKSCPVDGFAGSGTVCRAAADACDAVETCSGTSATCPADAKKASGTACTDDGNPCTLDQCNGTSSACQHPVGNAGAVCRAAAGECDVAETCTGTSATCPADGKKTSGTACTDDGNVCTLDQCDGSNVTCQHPAGNAGVVCRGAAGECDVAEACTGTSTTCPADAKKASGTVCTDDGNVCTLDQCDGSNVACQHPAGNAGTLCRAANGDCDVAETCTGSSASCPADAFKPSTVVCRVASGACDVAESCTGNSATCPADSKAPDGTTCNDGNACTTADACHGGTCSGNTVTCTGADQCHTVGACVPTTGCPAPVAVANGTSCDDGNACTTGDSCQTGTCTSGANTCVALDIVQTPVGFQTNPQINANLSVNTPAGAVPGDPVTFTFSMTNVDSFMRASANMAVTNTGTQPFVWGSYQVTLEYLSATTSQWVPVAETSFDQNGVQNDVPPLLHLNFANLVGSTISPGQQVTYDSTENVTLPSDIINLLGDPAEATTARVEIHIDTGSGTGITTDRDITQSFTDGETTATNVQARLELNAPSGTTFFDFPVSAVPAGATVGPTVITPAPPLPPRSAAASDAQYLSGLTTSFYSAVQILGNFTGNGAVSFPALAPALTPQKSGPAQGTSGQTLPFTVQLSNSGAADASGIQIVDLANGQNLGAQITPPTSVAAGANATVNFTVASSLDQAPGPFTDQAQVTWHDRNGNSYGPTSSAFTVNEQSSSAGYLSLTGAPPTGIPQIIASPLTLTATAFDQNGTPVAGVSVQFVVTGVNPQTTQVTTGPDGKAAFSYDGPNLGADTVTASASINGPTLQTSTGTFKWASTVPPSGGGTANPCTDRETPLDIVLVFDTSPSMFADDQIDAANAATDAFINNLSYPLDQVSTVLFSGGATLTAQLTSDPAAAIAETNTAFSNAIHACDNFCPGGSNFLAAFQTALGELQGPRHRAGSSPVIVFLSDGGNTGADPTAEIAAVKAAGIRIISLGYGTNVNVAEMRGLVASSPNDYFYAPSANELGWIFGNIDQDACRTQPPLVSAGGNQGLYEVRLPASLTLQGEVHGNGPRGDLDLTSTWTELSGPAPIAFANPASPVTDVVFTEPGTYVLQLEASDGVLTTADQATVTVDPAPSLVGANLAVALGAPGPLTVGTTETLTATLTDAQSNPIGNFAVQVVVTGANPTLATLTTNAVGVATFAYTGAASGIDTLQATAIGGTAQLASSPIQLTWTAAQSPTGQIVAQGWLGSPGQQSTVKGLVPVTVAAGVTVGSGTLSYWPATNPGARTILSLNPAGGPGTTLATLDTTTLRNGTYIIDLTGTDSQGNQQESEVLVTVAGDYKPGREVVELTDFTVSLAGLPIVVGRRYDSLEKDRVGDFGNGWSLTVGHPDLEVDPFHDVTLTMPGGRRVTFQFGLQPIAAGPIVFGFLASPVYIPEPGVFGTLSSNGCSLLAFDPSADAINPLCFESLFDPTGLTYAPTTYTYTDAFGTAYTMGADGSLKTIQDRNNNILTFTADGITNNLDSSRNVSFTRDPQGRISKILTPVLGDFFPTRLEYDYIYDGNGDLVQVNHPPTSVYAITDQYGYDAHRLTSAIDPDGHPARVMTYDSAGRLATDRDPMQNTTSYAYDVAAHTTTTTYPDTGFTVQKFDDNGMLLSFTDQLGNITKHEYDANRNETKRTNALNEVTTYTYDANGNQTSSTRVTLNETTSTTYNTFSDPLIVTNPVGNTTTLTYDASGLPTSISDSMGLLATFTSSEHGLPTSVSDAHGKTVVLNYDDAGDLTQRTDRLSRVTGYTYTGFGQERTVTDPRNGVTHYNYDFDGRLVSIANSLGVGWETSLDQNGVAFVRATFGQGRRDVYAFDADEHLTTTIHDLDDLSEIRHVQDFRGNELSTTDEANQTTTYTYDFAGRLIQSTYPDRTFTSQTYDALGRLASKTDERGKTTTYGYEPGCDCSDRLTSVTDPLGRTTSMTYDGMSRKTSMTDANNHTTFYVYDLRGHLVETDYPDHTSTHDTYDDLGRRTVSTDQTNETTRYGYDDEGQLISVTDPQQNVTQYGYDGNGNLTSVTDANDHATTYVYDASNRKVSRSLPLGMTETFSYDVANNMTTHIDFRGKTATYTFDRRYPTGRLTSKVPDPSLGEPTVTYAYNSTSTRSSMTDASGTTTYAYDQRNRLLTKATPAGTLTYTYDPSGNVASIDSSNPNGTSVGYTWDGANQLSTVTDNRLGGIVNAAYTAVGRPLTVSAPNGVGVTYGYDSVDRVTSLAWSKGTASAFASWAYTYSDRGQRLSSTDITRRKATYGYDPASRLVGETISGDLGGPGANGVLTYTIDPAGNRTTRTSTLAALQAQSFAYDPNDELASEEYNLNGNATNVGGHAYTYDFENRLVSRDGGAIRLVYDGDGNRVAKAVGGVMTQYLVDQLNPTGSLQVVDQVSNGEVQVRYTYGNMLVSQTRNQGSANTTSFYGYDAHGNITFLTDATGVETDSYTYDAWGNLIGSSGSTINARLYAGEEFDSDLGLIDLRARYYNPVTGRFLTLDPATRDVAFPSTAINRYLYAGDDPAGRVDPSGRADIAEYGIGLAVAALLATAYAEIRIGQNNVRSNFSGVGTRTACNFASFADRFAAVPTGSVWDYQLCAIRLPWPFKKKPFDWGAPGAIPESILKRCGPPPPNPDNAAENPKCDEIGDRIFKACLAAGGGTGECLARRNSAITDCENIWEEKQRKMREAYNKWEDCAFQVVPL